MEAAAATMNLTRRLHSSPLLQLLYHHHHHLLHHHLPNPRLQCLKTDTLLPPLKSNPTIGMMLPRSFSRSTSYLNAPSATPLTFPLTFTTTSFHFNDSAIQSRQHDSVFTWNRAAEGRVGGVGRMNRVATVVLLGWLGAEPKHLRRYAEIYNAHGIHAVRFVVPVSELLCFDLGRRVERRIEVLANELESWVSEREPGAGAGAGAGAGGDRCLIFHTFSNTGWLVYGSILDRWKDRPELNQKIRGCIVDSGGDPELNPKVWAAGFSAAILKKRSSLTKPSIQGLGASESDAEGRKGDVQGKESDLLESVVVSVLEKLFSVLLNLPDVNKRLMKIIVRLSEKPPSCPQLYLYSTADKVIPYHSVESFMEIQRAKGIEVDSFNFQSSPHVDHFRTFSNLYTSVLHNFLKKCLCQTK